MMAGNPSWWSMHLHHPSALLTNTPSSSSIFPQYVVGSSSSYSLVDNHEEQFPQSWSQLLLGGFTGEDRYDGPGTFQPKKLENWRTNPKATSNSNLYGYHANEEFQPPRPPLPLPPPLAPLGLKSWRFPPQAWVLYYKVKEQHFRLLLYNMAADGSNSNTQPPLDHSSECNSKGSSTGGGVWKKARVQPSSSQPPLKVRKEKLGDRITTLHQLVSPFGKTDTASVLLEAIGYIRFLQGQIEALSSPYMGTATPNMRNQQSGQGERGCAFPEDGQEKQEHKPKDLRSRGLCLVPVSCTQQVGSENGADYWAPPALGGGGF
ncbi:Transcription factor bHLH68 [Hibiscus syriacus]|uniref:Transcription factor bHLH68 n=1 Tax=Hibiscus syriacus TaxID=106335 RepID=A0A6A2ZVT0_HIBSY|nr:Transcription factor bHLH68 [Hibiscus syriacus]